MKKISLYTIMAVILMLGAVSIASAEAKGPVLSQNRGNEAGQRAENGEQARSASTTSVSRDESLKTRAENRFSKMSNRFNLTLERVQNIMARLVSRMEKIKAVGGNTAEAEKAVNSARTSISNATTTLASMTALAKSIDSMDPTATSTKAYKDGIKNLQKYSNDAQRELMSAFTSMTKAIGSLKGLKIGENASTTKKAY